MAFFCEVYRKPSENREVKIRIDAPRLLEKTHQYQEWAATYHFTENGQTRSETVVAARWIVCVLMTLKVAAAEMYDAETEWVTTEGIPVWVTLPRTVPFEWGYKVYKDLQDGIEQTIAKHLAEIEARHEANQKWLAEQGETKDEGEGH